MIWGSQITRTHEEMLEWKKSAVRRWVTYWATFFAFLGGGLLMMSVLFEPYLNDILGPTEGTGEIGRLNIGAAKDIYLAILPTAIGIIGYWFGNRKPKEPNMPNKPSGVSGE